MRSRRAGRLRRRAAGRSEWGDAAPAFPRRGEPFELAVESLAYGGAGVGRRGGIVVFVPYAAPGDRVRVRPVEDRGRYIRAELLEVLEPSPHRVAPPCPHFGACGGCQWQHVAYGCQLQAKRRIVADCLARIGGAPAAVEPVVESPLPYRYRSRVRLHVDAAGRVGFFRRASRDLVEIAGCPLLDDRLDAAIGGLRGGRGPTGRSGVLELTVGDDGVVRAAEGLPFGQVNPAVNALLQQRLAARVAAEFGAEARIAVLDLYCGDGNLSLPLAGRARRIVGADASAAAAASAAARARKLAAAAEYRAAAVDPPLLSSLAGERFDLLIVDPPRAGMPAAVSRAAAALAAPLVALVSCAPPTLARDLRAFLERGYLIDVVQPFDMFPQTFHVETLVMLRPAGPAARLSGPFVAQQATARYPGTRGLPRAGRSPRERIDGAEEQPPDRLHQALAGEEPPGAGRLRGRPGPGRRRAAGPARLPGDA